jgi:hypothetical protein
MTPSTGEIMGPYQALRQRGARAQRRSGSEALADIQPTSSSDRSGGRTNAVDGKLVRG